MHLQRLWRPESLHPNRKQTADVDIENYKMTRDILTDL